MRPLDRKQTPDIRADGADEALKAATTSQRTDEKPSTSESRPKEVVDYIPIQNQAAAQKLLQKMSHPTQKHQQQRGQRYKGKGKDEEKPVFTLDEWERSKTGVNYPSGIEEASDEDLAWQLQNQFDLEDQVQMNRQKAAAENIKLKMFRFERDDGGEHGGARGRVESSHLQFSSSPLASPAWTLTIAAMERTLIQPIAAILISSAIALRAYKRRSLNFSGALAGFIVMAIHLAANFRYAAMLLVFFFSSSALTKRGASKKRAVDAEYKEGGQRNWIQVLSNSIIATVLVVTIWSLTGWEDSCLDAKQSTLIKALVGGLIGHYCCCNGDTWSSELGVLSDEEPRMITTFKQVPKGTNGAVTIAGLLAAAEAGGVIGLTYLVSGLIGAKCFHVKQLLIIPLSALAGLCGSLIDSLLGATVQYSGYCQVRKKVVGTQSPTVKKISGLDILDNNGVNLVSILLTTVLTSLVFTAIF
ncbi:hypothetical protein Dimus_034428 [Dionaea muscipula]